MKSLGYSSLFLAGLLSVLSATACVAPSDESPCEPGDAAASDLGDGEGACEVRDAEASAGEEAPSEEEEDAQRVKAPSRTPQRLCSPICDRI
ncbi:MULTISPECIES: hypothetical protein [Sorangium]|uniref:hypothetical protein n=1 Tax=Sorangium TaxID=39643 RepID=UPI003D9C3A51